MRARARSFGVFSLFFIVAVFIAVFWNSRSSALEMNQAVERCRASEGKPAYSACMQNGGNHPGCFGRARSIVQSCVKNAMNAARPKATLFSVDKVSPPAAKPSAEELAADATASFVAPRRTVSDIGAILDQQKPDPGELAKLTTTADAAPAGLKGDELADFYYKRAQVRLQLGRSDALDDAELAVKNSSSQDYINRGSRHEQLLMGLLR